MHFSFWTLYITMCITMCIWIDCCYYVVLSSCSFGHSRTRSECTNIIYWEIGSAIYFSCKTVKHKIVVSIRFVLSWPILHIPQTAGWFYHSQFSRYFSAIFIHQLWLDSKCASSSSWLFSHTNFPPIFMAQWSTTTEPLTSQFNVN